MPFSRAGGPTVNDTRNIPDQFFMKNLLFSALSTCLLTLALVCEFDRKAQSGFLLLGANHVRDYARAA